MLRSVLSMSMIGLLAACAAARDNAAHATATAAAAGWRKGIVVQVGDRDSLGSPIDGDCRARSRADADPLLRYVEVRYFVGRHAHLRIVPIDGASAAAAGDAIWFRSSDCSAARVTAPDR